MKCKQIIKIVQNFEWYCECNDIKYWILFKNYKKYDYNKKYFYGIGMILTDIEKLQNIVNDSCDWFLEGWPNNILADDFTFRFYDENTTYIDIDDFASHTSHGAFINIFPLEKQACFNKHFKLLYKYIKKLKKLGDSNYRLCKINHIPILFLIKLIYKLFGKKHCVGKLYDYYKKNICFSTWSFINKLSDVSIDGKPLYDTNIILEPDISVCYGDFTNFDETNTFYSSNISFMNLIDRGTESKISEVISLKKRYLKTLDKAKKERNFINSEWEKLKKIVSANSNKNNNTIYVLKRIKRK